MDEFAAVELTAHVPRLLLRWEERFGSARHASIDGTLVFADVSGFTRLSEALARRGGKAGAEQMADIINRLFGEMLGDAADHGGEMLKYGGDAMLLFFAGEDHPAQAAAAAWAMQRTLAKIGRVDTGRSAVRLRMSVGMHSGAFDVFAVGRRHQELLIAGPDTTTTVEMEAAASAGEVLLSPATAAALAPPYLGRELAGGALLRRRPPARADLRGEAVPATPVERFLSPRLHDHLAAGGADPDHRLATVLFLQILGLDRWLGEEGPGAAAAAEALDDTITVIQEELERFDVPFLATDLAADGAKVMAASGAPLARADDADRAVRASLAILARSTPLPIRIGANRGHVFAGEVGPTFRRTYTTLGDVTNTAARVMGRATPGQFLVLDSVRHAVTGAFGFDELDPFLAKGKRFPLTPLLVSEAAAPEGPALVNADELVGRDGEARRIDEVVRGWSAGAGGAAVVTGAAGSGKSALLAAVLTRNGVVPSITARATSFDAETPFAVVRRLVAAAAPDVALAEDASAFVATVASRAPEAASSAPLFASVFGHDAATLPAELAALGAGAKATTLRDGLVALLLALGRGAVWVIEDVHWADASSRAVLARLAAQAASEALLLLSTASADVDDLGSVVHLGPLDPASMQRLARRLAPTWPVDEVDAAVTRAAGNVYHLLELIRSRAADAEAPESLEAAIAAHIDDLPPALRRWLRELAVLGPAADWATAASFLGIDLAAFREAVDGRLAAFLEHGSEGVRFRQALVRDVAYGSLPFRVRRDLHRRAADLLTDAGEEHLPVLAVHLAGAGDVEGTWHVARKAAQRATATHAPVEAMASYRRALEAANRLGVGADEAVDVLFGLGACELLVGRTADARLSYLRALRLVQDPVRRSDICFRLGNISESTGSFGAARNWYRRGLRTASTAKGDEAAKWRTRLLLAVSNLLQAQGRFADARRYTRRGLADAQLHGDEPGIAHAYSQFLSIACFTGEDEPGIDTQLPVRIYERVGDLQAKAQYLNLLGMRAQAKEQWQEAVAAFTEAREMSRRAGHVLQQGETANNLGEVLLSQGRWDEAAENFEVALDAFRPSNYRLGLGVVAMNLGWAEALRGRVAAAEERLGEASSQLAGTAYGLLAEARRAAAMLLAGDVDGAMGAALDLIERHPGAGFGVEALCRQVLAQGPGRRDEVTARLRAAVEAAGASRVDRALALRIWAARDARGETSVPPPEPWEPLLEGLEIVTLPPLAAPDGVSSTRQRRSATLVTSGTRR